MLADDWADVATQLKTYFDGCSQKVQQSLAETAKRRTRVLADALLLSCNLHMLGDLPIHRRRQLRVAVQTALKTAGYPVSDDAFKDESLFALAVADIEDRGAWQVLATDCCVPLGFVYELFFMLSESGPVVLLHDDWGLGHHLLKRALYSSKDVSIVHCAKLATAIPGLQKLGVDRLLLVHDGLTRGLAYDSGTLLKRLSNTPLQIPTSRQSDPTEDDEKATVQFTLGQRCRYIFLRPAVDAACRFTGRGAGLVDVVDCRLDDSDSQELWIAINKIFYKNLLPDLHEKWLELATTWHMHLSEQERTDKSIEKRLKQLTTPEDLTRDTMASLGELLQHRHNPHDTFKEYLVLVNQHQLLVSYSNALAIVWCLYSRSSMEV
jgi:hypothetical protein